MRKPDPPEDTVSGLAVDEALSDEQQERVEPELVRGGEGNVDVTSPPANSSPLLPDSVSPPVPALTMADKETPPVRPKQPTHTLARTNQVMDRALSSSFEDQDDDVQSPPSPDAAAAAARHGEQQIQHGDDDDDALPTYKDQVRDSRGSRPKDHPAGPQPGVVRVDGIATLDESSRSNGDGDNDNDEESGIVIPSAFLVTDSPPVDDDDDVNAVQARRASAKLVQFCCVLSLPCFSCQVTASRTTTVILVVITMVAIVVGVLAAVGIFDQSNSGSPISPQVPTMAPTTPGPAPSPVFSFGYENNVPESSKYTLAYDLDLPDRANWFGGFPAYNVVNTTPVFSFDRVAYYIELESAEFGRQWLWVSMQTFTQNAGQIAVPVRLSGAIFQQFVTDMNVVTNQETIAPSGTLEGITGNLEFWPHNYGEVDAQGIERASDRVFDFGDTRSSTFGHGSMQVHVPSRRQTLFALNNWGGSPGNLDVGIGNNPNGNPDWTFENNGNIYTRKNLQVLVQAAGAIGPSGFASNLESGYRLVYELDIPDAPDFDAIPPNYNFDMHLFQSTFTRVAYYMELQSSLYGTQWVWVSLDAFTDDAGMIGIPTFASGAVFQQTIMGVNLFSNMPELTGEGIEGNIEFWPFDYGTENAAGVTGANSSVYDYGDDRVSSGNFGSMQIHIPSLQTTVFAFNRWKHGVAPDVGIGNRPFNSEPDFHPDWTRSQNALLYTKRKLQVYVQ